MDNRLGKNTAVLSWLYRSWVLFSLAGVVAIGLCVVTYRISYTPLIAQKKEITESIAALSQQLSLAQAKKSKENKNDKETEETLLSKIPLEQEELDFIQEINKYKKKSNAKLSSLDVGKPFADAKEALKNKFSIIPIGEDVTERQRNFALEGATFIRQKEITFSASGSYKQVIDFWKGLARRQRLIDTPVWNIQFDASPQYFGQDQPALLEATLLVYATVAEQSK